MIIGLTNRAFFHNIEIGMEGSEVRCSHLGLLGAQHQLDVALIICGARGGKHFPDRGAARKENKVILVKSSGKLLVTVLAVALSSSIGFGAALNVDGTIDAVGAADNYDWVSIDDDGPTPQDYTGSSSDIAAVHWGQAPGATFPTDPTDVWYTMGMSTVTAPLNTLGDGTNFFPTQTNVQLGIRQGGVALYAMSITMFNGSVKDGSVTMWDLSTNPTPTPVTLDSSTLKYAVGNSLEIAVHRSAFANLLPAQFDFSLMFEGGGTNADDSITDVVPEPATMSLLAVGGLFLARRRRKRLAA
jgi:hypothetical protein